MDVQATVDGSSTLQWPDYLVIGVVLSISTGIGIYYRFTGGKQRTAEEYFSADRSMSIVPLAIALMVSFMSAITLLGISSENYLFGTQFTVIYLGGGIATFIAMYVYLPVFFELNLMSVFEYLERRFGVIARMTASVANFSQLMLYTGVVLFAPSLALEATTGLSGTTSVLLIGLICTFYSTIGGIKAVLITDVFQGILMFASLFCVLAVAAGDLEGGLSSVWDIAMERGRIDYSNFSFDPTVRHTWWNLLIGGCTMFLSLYGVNQVQVQRLLTVKSLKASQVALFLNWPIMLAMGGFTSYAGLVLFAVYKDCDPVASGKISSTDKIMPFFAAERMSRIPGLTGLFISGVFSASLSTISAMLNSLSAVALEDYVKPLYKGLNREFPEGRATLIGKILAVTNGIICLMLAFLARSLGSLVEAAIAVTGAIGGPLLGIFTLGMCVESANEWGATVGLITALLVNIWTAFGQPKPPNPKLPVSTAGCDNFNFTVPTFTTANQSLHSPSSQDESSYFYLYRISYMWYTPMGATITIVLGFLASLVVRKFSKLEIREPDPSLFTPIVASRIRRRRRDTEKTTSSQVFVLESNLKK